MPFVKGQSGNPKGRPATADKHAGAIAKAEKRIADRLPELIDLEFELAQGVTVQEETLVGPKLYKRPPDRGAIEYLANRIMGKPTERQEVDVEGAITIVKGYATKDVSPDAWDD